MEVLAIALTTALATKAFEEIGEKTGENLLETATELVKSLFKPEELVTLNLSADHLSDPVAQGKLIGKLEDRLVSNPDVAQQLEVLMEKLNAASDVTITNKKISNDSDVKNEVELSSASTGNNEILNEDIDRSKVSNTIKRK